MMEGVVALLGIGALVAWISHLARESSSLRRDWRQAVHDAGVQVTSEKAWGFVGIIGRAGEHRVLIDELRTRQGDTGTRIVVEGSSGITLSREGLGAALEKRLGVREIQLGDDVFDKGVYVRGSPELVRALLDSEAREQLRRLLEGWIRIDSDSVYGFEAEVSLNGGHLQADFRAQWNEKLQANLGEVLTALLAVARRLEPPADVAARIAENTRSEPEWRVRAQNLALLAASYPEHAVTHEALMRACQDENDAVRLRAALSLKDEGHETLRDIAARADADDACAATAVAALGDHLTGEAAISILDEALRRGRAGTARACLAALGRRGGPAAVDRLARVLVEEVPDHAVAAAQALEATGAPAAEAPLLRALSDLPVVGLAAARALGQVGTAAAILPLKEAAAREAPGSELQRAMGRAVVAIQSRLHGASPGQVSLAEGETGQLSLAHEDPAGRISLPDPGKDT